MRKIVGGDSGYIRPVITGEIRNVITPCFNFRIASFIRVQFSNFFQWGVYTPM